MAHRHGVRRLVTAAATLVTLLAAVVSSAPSAAAAGIQCLHTDAPPPLAGNGAVLWAPTNPQYPDIPNTLVLPTDVVAPRAKYCAEVASRATSIQVARGSAVAVHGTTYYNGRDMFVFPYGGTTVTSPPNTTPLVGWPAPNWYEVSSVEVIDAALFLNRYATCRGCDLSGRSIVLPGPAPAGQVFPKGRFAGDVSGSDLTNARLQGKAAGYTFDGSNLTGATVDQATLYSSSLADVTLNGTTFINGTVLFGTHFQGPRFSRLTPPLLTDSVIGATPDGQCTTFDQGSWLDVDFSRVGFGSGQPSCASGSAFRNGTIPFKLWSLYAKGGQAANIALTNSTVVATAADRDALKGADLHGRNLSGFAVSGLSLDLRGAKLDGADLTGAQLPLAQFSGASLTNVVAPRADFQGATFGAQGSLPAATFAGAHTNLRQADLTDTDLSGVSFVGADISGAALIGARAPNTDFNGIRANGTSFADAHLYGDGNAFENATDLSNADFTGAVIAGDAVTGGGFNFTGAALSGAHFDRSVCVACTFTAATLTQAQFTGAYLPGVNLAGAALSGSNFAQAWVYCQTPQNGACSQVANSSPPQWSWPLKLGSGEVSMAVPFSTPTLGDPLLAGVTTCPDGTPGASGCANHLLPDPTNTPWSFPPCSASAHGSCPTPTSTWLPTASAPLAAAPLSTAPAAPPTWVSALPPTGYYTGYGDGTVRLVSNGTQSVVAGTSGAVCDSPTSPCGDGGPATAARLGRPSGEAVGLDGTLYIADSVLRRVRAVHPDGTITTVAGSGATCAAGRCGDGGPATKAALAAANGVAVDPAGNVFVADGAAGIRRVTSDGAITTLAPGQSTGTVVAVTTGLDGPLYASTRGPDAVITVNPATGAVKRLVGTGTSGYNGSQGQYGPQSGTATQVNQPTGLAATQDGYLVFADTGNHLVRRLNLSNGNMTDDVAGVVDAAGNPQSGFNGDGKSSDQTLLSSPLAVAATSTAVYLVADTGNARFREVGPRQAQSLPGDPHQPPSGPRTFVLDCTSGKTWTCQRLPGPTGAADVRTQKNVRIVVSRGATVVASGPLLLLGGGKRYLVTEAEPLEPGAYTLVVSAGTSSRTVQATITAP